METLSLVILAKSYKPGGRCIAGRLAKYNEEKKTLTIGDWFRPVADADPKKGSITEEMYKYEDGTEVKILDVVEIPVIKHAPIDGQPENYVIDKSKKWKKTRSLTPGSIPKIAENPVSIWHDPESAINTVTANYDEKGLITQSLYLIKPCNLQVTQSHDFDEYSDTYKKKLTASFSYLGKNYENISITCPSTKLILFNQYPKEGEPSTTKPLRNGDNYVLCMSLSPRFGDSEHHYKLVATIFDHNGYLQRKYAA